ncbi:MAG: conserved rane protein [Proteobacteria bacterium]|nr:conserved rane protein [Pseudomonadota bacterium]
MSDASADPVANWREEMQSAYLYRVIADIERGTPRARLFSSLAGEAESQAAIWAGSAKKAGRAVPAAFAPDMRARVVAHLARRYGPRNIRGVLAAMKVRGLSVYTHAQPGHPAPTSIEEMAKRHRGLGTGGNLRAAVFGVNDGLVSNASLILGVAGAAASNDVILLSGVARPRRWRRARSRTPGKPSTPSRAKSSVSTPTTSGLRGAPRRSPFCRSPSAR